MKRTLVISFLGVLLLLLMIPGEVFAEVYSVISTQLDDFWEEKEGIEASNVTGYCTISWKEGTEFGFFYAWAEVSTGSGNIYKFEFILVAIEGSDHQLIKGYWDVIRDGNLLCDDCSGEVYALDSPVGDSFKLDVSGWALSAHITRRFDF